MVPIPCHSNFNQGSDADMDTVNTQNRVQAGAFTLPAEVQAVGGYNNKIIWRHGLDFLFELPKRYI